MLFLILIIILLAIFIGPQLLVTSVLKRHNQPRDDIPGTGGEFANHLIHKLDLASKVKVEPTEQGDHYDPSSKTVALSPLFFQQNSLTAIVVAAHEVGHAMQDAENNRWMRLREKLLIVAHVIEKIAPLTLAIAPIALWITKAPGLSLFIFFIGFLSIAMTTLLHLLTLPVELDASFNKALPLLEKGNYLPTADDHKAAHSILRAAALTYVAQSLFNLLNIGYWLRLLRP